jgi:ribonucleoside-diphosphate reductase beta chain
MGELLLPALGVVEETFAQHDPMPFGLVLEDFLVYATTQFQKRLDRIERGAQTRSLELVYELAHADADAD